VDLNVCPACGEWSDDFVVAQEAVLACPACGQRWPFARLPLFALTGPSGAGKSAVAAILAGRLQQSVVLEQDLLWLPDQLNPADDYRQFRRLWLRLVAALHQNGRPVLLCGTVVPGQLEACPERRLVGEIHYLGLVCGDAELEARLRARPAWRAWTDEKVARMLAFNQWVKDNAATTTPPMQLLDTTGHSVQDSAACVQAWVLARLVASE
jgi:energy-coupling factor transporter ATP-binding protein EcfA2